MNLEKEIKNLKNTKNKFKLIFKIMIYKIKV